MEARLVRVPLGRRLAPADAALLVRGDARPFALCGAWAGGGAIAGSEPVRVAGPDDDPFALLDDLPALAPGAPAPPGVVGGGWFGYLGSALARRLEAVGASPPRPVALPDVVLAFYDHVVRCDAAGAWWFEALWTQPRARALRARLALLRGRSPRERGFATAPWRSVPTPAGHGAAVAAVRERIAAGDLFQANVCLRLESELAGDPVDLFTAGTRALAPDRAAYLAGPWGALASLSPELFLAHRGRRVVSAPIKGTASEPGALAASAKDRAENVMIVDLVRNDLGRVGEAGSVRVEALCEPRAHTGVWHLVSEVAALTDAGHGDVVRAAFPPGSVTGAPKLAALAAIAEVESTGREAYTGAIGFASPLAGLELSVAIRTFESRAGRIWLGVGGGVVADSDPVAEAREARTKAAPLLAAIGGRLATAPRRRARRPSRLGPRPLPRPDPALGIVETFHADADPAPHLARLAASCRALYGVEPDVPALAGPGPRVRLVALPDGRVTVEHGPLPAGSGPVALRTAVVPGGLGEHKWRDRRALAALAAAGAPHEVVLLVDLDGLVLEAARANVFLEEDGALVTPPADGRILPGVTRAGLLATRGAREEPLALERLLEADAVLLTGALRGVERAVAVDGRALRGTARRAGRALGAPAGAA